MFVVCGGRGGIVCGICGLVYEIYWFVYGAGLGRGNATGGWNG